MRTLVIAKLQVEGLHKWPGVLEHKELEPVHWLAGLHRHIFHITVKKEVKHNDREVEIIMLKRNVAEYLNKRYFTESANCLFFNNMSCEMIAHELVKYFGLVACEVLEDNENGAAIFVSEDEITNETELVLMEESEVGAIHVGGSKIEGLDSEATGNMSSTLPDTKLNYEIK